MRLTIAGLRACVVVAAVAGASPAAWAKEYWKAHFWVEVSDTVLTPGESVEFTIWMEFEPKAPAIVFSTGAKRQIAGFGDVWNLQLHIQPQNGVTGTWGWVWPPEWHGFWDYGDLPNMLYAIRVDNYLSNYNTQATKANPLWILKAIWTPDSYDATTVVIDPIPLTKVTIAAYTSPNSMAYPWNPVKYYTSHAPTTIKIRPEVCPADCDESGELDIDDFICFQTYFALGDPLADCDGDGVLNIDDFICFQTAFAIGC
jgi:hypothetical protein